MKKFCRLLLLCLLTFSLASEPFAFAGAANDGAEPPPPLKVIINEVKLGGGTAEPKEYVTLFNASDTEVSLDGWKLEYAKSSAAVTCDNPAWYDSASASATELSGTLQPHSVSTPIGRALTDGKSGSLHLTDALGAIHDLVGWGADAPCSDSNAAPIPASGKSLQRYVGCTDGYPIDTDDNAHDFIESAPLPAASVSTHYLESCPGDGSGTDDGNTTPPTCEGIVVSEILPNPGGSDSGREFVELHNPTDKPIALDSCSLQTTANAKTYTFGEVTLPPGAYRAFYDSQTGLTLPNTSGGTVWLLSPTTELQAITYPADMADDVSWALLGGTWQRTYTLTPAAANILLAEKPCPAGQARNHDTSRCQNIAASGPSLKPCRSGQYRSPETNRCRNIIVSASTLVPCKTGQTRNPATNRCRSVLAASASLQPCKPGQIRNPATNRCKSATANSGQLKPCQPGWERNPETNRCRKGSVLGSATTDVQDIKAPAKSSIRWLLIGGVAVGALGYAVYEWRQELVLKFAGSKKFITSITRPKK